MCMKFIKLTRGFRAMVDNEDFEELNKHKWSVMTVKKNKHNTIYYAFRTQDGHSVLMHREILGLKLYDGKKADHMNHNGLNNQRKNLRMATERQNIANNRKSVRKLTSKYKGVCLIKGKYWVAHLFYKKQSKIIFCKSEREAARKYDAFQLEHYGTFAYVNFKSSVRKWLESKLAA
jgi:hypothetical protein